METIGFFGLFGLLSAFELAAFAGFFLLLTIGCVVDRRADKEAFKWWAVLALVLVSVWHWFDPLKAAGVEGVWNVVKSLAFWLPALTYFGIGLVYCIPEFVMDVRRAAKFYGSEWETFKQRTVTLSTYNAAGEPVQAMLKRAAAGQTGVDAAAVNVIGHPGPDNTQKVTIAQLLTRAQQLADTEADTTEAAHLAREAKNVVTDFVNQYRFKNRIVQLDGSKMYKVEPVINKIELAEHIAAWTIFWPFYAVALVLGDLLAEVWDALADFLANFAGRWVKLTFKDVFKLS